ncbi:MAG: hypothetical protein GY803_24765, partial [Chloroflexi bacterium]|nr:hypothetical protein [Chloroflexota bacterium]
MNTKFEDSRKYKRLLAVIFLALAFGILATNVIAEQEEIASATFTYYVDAAVSASGDGLTPATAFKTLAEAQNAVWVHPDASAIFEIYIAPGVYEEDGLIFGKSVHLHGAGAGATVIDASQPRSNPEQTGIYNGNALYFGGAELSFLVEDLTIVGRQHINPDADPEFLQPFEAIYVYSTRHTIATLRRVKIFDCGRGIFAWGGMGFFPPFGDSGPVIIQNSIFDNNGGAIHVQYNGFAPYDGGGMPHAIVENSVIANSGEYGFFNSDPLHTLRNNIFINNAEAFRTAFHPDEDRQMTLSHNLFWGNGSDYDNPNGVISSVGELHSDSLLSEDGFFYPSPASPVIDTGDPNAIYKDQDGSRNDMGIYGGPHAPGVR